MIGEERIYHKKLIYSTYFYLFLEKEKDRVNEVIREILGSYGRTDLAEPLFFCISELIINAIRANIKRLNKLEQEYTETENILEAITEYELEERLHKHKLRVEFKVFEIPGGLSFEIYNTAPLEEEDERKIRAKLKELMEMVQKGIEIDPIEIIEKNGKKEGIGFAIVVYLLKQIGVDPKYFRIGKTKPEKEMTDWTMARIEIPIDERNFLSIRDYYEKYLKKGDK